MANAMNLYDVTSSKSTHNMLQQVREIIEPEARITGLRRAVLTQLREILRQVAERRVNLVRMFGRRLWDRYKRDIKHREVEMTFPDWLIEKEVLENTFASTGNRGFSMKQRVRWTKFFMDRVTHPAVAPEDDPTNTDWFTNDATHDLGIRHPMTNKLVRVSIVESPYEEGAKTFGFTKRESHGGGAGSQGGGGGRGRDVDGG